MVPSGVRFSSLFIVALVACGHNEGSHHEGTNPTAPPAATAPAPGTQLVGAPEDLRRHLKPEVAAKAPPDDRATVRELPIDLHGVAAKVVWRTFTDGPNAYLLSVGLAVVTPVPDVTVAAEPAMNPTNAGTEAAVIESVPLKLRWTQTHADHSITTGEVSVRISADGTGAKI